ncbi:hypothetical protein AMTRI_Chr12g273180 [Amborella trichopoda]
MSVYLVRRMRKPSPTSFIDTSMLLPFGSGLTAWLAAQPMVLRCQYFSSTSLEPLLCLAGSNLLTFKGRSRDIIPLLSDIQRLVIMRAYASLPLTAVPNLLLFLLLQRLTLS